METEEALKCYLDEVKDAQNDIINIEEEVHVPNGESHLFIDEFCIYTVKYYAS